jgi:hypothetical protein
MLNQCTPIQRCRCATDCDRFPANFVGIPAWWAAAMHNSIQRNAVVWADGILRRLSLSRMSFETRGSSHKQGRSAADLPHDGNLITVRSA